MGEDPDSACESQETPESRGPSFHPSVGIQHKVLFIPALMLLV